MKGPQGGKLWEGNGKLSFYLGVVKDKPSDSS